MENRKQIAIDVDEFVERHAGAEVAPVVADNRWDLLTPEDLQPLDCSGAIDAYFDAVLSDLVSKGAVILREDGTIVQGLALISDTAYPSKLAN